MCACVCGVSLLHLQAAKVSVESQLQGAKENAEHFKALSLSNEAALEEVNSVSKELQQDMEGKLKEVCACVRACMQGWCEIAGSLM